MPNFTWDVTPVAFGIPRNPALVVLALVAVVMFIAGMRSRQNDMSVFGLVMAVLTGIAYKFLPDPLEIRWYSLLFVGVFLGGYSLLNWQVRRGGGDEEVAGDFIVYGVLGVLIGARLGHVLFYDLDHALHDPMWVLKIWTGGLASHGATLGLIVAMYLFTRSRHVPFLEGADRFAFSAALGATLVRLGNFFNSEIVGRKTDGSWGVRFPHFGPDAGNPPLRHPSQLYEVAMGLLVMLVLYIVDKKAGEEKRPRGLLISTFFVVYFAGRFFVEYFKEYQKLPESSPLTMGQYLSIPAFFLGVYGVFWSLKRRLPAGWPSADEEDEDDEEERLAERARRRKKKRLYDPDVDDEFEDDAAPGDGADDGDDAELDDEAPPRKVVKKKKKKKTSSSGGTAPTSGPTKKRRKKKKKKRPLPE